MDRVGRYSLAGGFVLLALGIGVAVVRHNHDADAKRARYDSALHRASAQPPRFAVSYVEVPLLEVRRFTHGRYTTVKTEVARRIETGRPPLHPDFAVLAGSRTDPTARLFREGRVTRRKVSVMALLVTQTTPGAVTRMRLEVVRLGLRGFESFWDALDLLPDRNTSIFAHHSAGTKRSEFVEWNPRAGETAFVPLSVLHLFRVPQIPANAAIIEELGGVTGAFVTSDVVLGPRRLLVRRPQIGDVEIAIGPALDPLVLSSMAK